MPPKKAKQPAVQENVSLGPQVAEGTANTGLVNTRNTFADHKWLRHTRLWGLPNLRFIQRHLYSCDRSQVSQHTTSIEAF